MKHLLFPIFLILSQNLSIAQNNSPKSSTYILLNTETKEPIAFAHIQAGETVVVSNQYGKFEIKTDLLDSADVLIITCVGYEAKSIPTTSLKDFQVIEISAETSALREVVISDLSVTEILQKAERKLANNYHSKQYLANYQMTQFIFQDSTEVLLGSAREKGLMINQQLTNSSGTPDFKTSSTEVSSDFLRYDTARHLVSPFKQEKRSITPGLLLSFDPLTQAYHKSLHVMPPLFSEGFYQSTQQEIVSIVEIQDESYYLISILPENREIDSEMKEQLKALYMERLRELVERTGRHLSDSAMHASFAEVMKRPVASSYAQGLLLVNTKDYGITYSLIKFNTFKPDGKIHSRVHVSAAYLKKEKKYYLQNLELVMQRTLSPELSLLPVFFFSSLSVGNQEFHKAESRFKASQIDSHLAVVADQVEQMDPSKLHNFIAPIKKCGVCELEPMVLFGRQIY